MEKMESIASDISMISTHPTTEASARGDCPYVWDVSLNIEMQGRISRLASRHHKIKYELNSDGNQGRVVLADELDKSMIPQKDFVLLIRDSEINLPTGFTCISDESEQAIMVNVLVDLTPEAQRLKQLQQPV